MGRRSDHSREELEELILAAGSMLMAESGYARFSTREVAKRIGYSVGTIYNVFGSADALILAINTRTFGLWTEHLRAALAGAGDDRIAALVSGYFAFAAQNTNLWMAIYDHRLPAGMAMPERDAIARGALTGIVSDEVATVLGDSAHDRAEALARSLVATVHGHCAFVLTGSFALMGEDRPQDAALARVWECLAEARRPVAAPSDDLDAARSGDRRYNT